MLGIGSIFSIASGTGSVIQGLGTIKTAGKIAGYQKDIANIQYDINKSEIDRAYNINVEGTLENYVALTTNMLDKAEDTRAALNLQTGNKKNVEKGSDSFTEDSKKVLDQEIQENLMSLVSSKSFELSELANQRNLQLYQLGNNYDGVMNNINMVKNQVMQQGIGQITAGSIKAAEAGYNLYQQNSIKDFGVDSYNGDYQFNYTPSYQAPKLSFGDMKLNGGTLGGEFGWLNF